MIRQLEKTFIGTGEVKDYIFNQIESSEAGYIYHVKTESSEHFEVIRIKLSPVCIDFENRIYSEEDFKETYPKSNHFGDWAWCTNNKDKAYEIFAGLKNIS